MQSDDVYAVLRGLAHESRPKFRALYIGTPGLFHVVDHFNIGRGWLVRNLETGAIVRSTLLSSVEVLASEDSAPASKKP